MSRAANPFLDPAVVGGHLYATADRLARRTSALHRAKVAGRHAAQVIAELAMSTMPSQPWLTAVDVGCGRGTTTRVLADQLRPAQLIALDVSPAVLAAARARLSDYGPVRFVCADFHHLPLRDASCHLVVAAFCLYHAARPAAVVGEIARCLVRRGVAILVTKSIDSYRKLDELVAASGLDPQATMRPSLYETAHSGNLTELAASALTVRQVVHEEHRFRFIDLVHPPGITHRFGRACISPRGVAPRTRSLRLRALVAPCEASAVAPSVRDRTSGWEHLAHAAEYLATSPRYALPGWLGDGPSALAAALRDRLPDRPVTAASTVTYVVAAQSSHRDGGQLA